MLAGFFALLLQQHGPPRTTPAGARPVAIEHAHVLPMDRDTLLADYTVITDSGRIVWLGPSSGARIPPNAERIDARGRYLMPGIADMHVHIASAEQLERYASAGITTVRNMHGEPRHVVWRSATARGALIGPTIYTAGPPVGQYRYLKDDRFVELRTLADADSLVARQIAAGYDLIKVIQRMSVPVYDHLLRVAHSKGIPVVGHVVPGVGLEHSVAAGQTSIEHATGLGQTTRFFRLADGDSATVESNVLAIARGGAWLGTIVSSRNGQCTSPSPQVRRIVGALRRNRVKLLAGSDAGIGPLRPDVAIHCELWTLVAAGLPAYEALAAATVNAGQFVAQNLQHPGLPFGTITTGARADLTLLSEDPRTTIETTARPIGVLLRGIWRPAATPVVVRHGAPR